MHPASTLSSRARQAVRRAIAPALLNREPQILNDMADIARACQERGYSSVLLIASRALTGSATIDALVAGLAEAGIATHVYHDVQAPPTTVNVEAARILYSRNHCQAIIGFGGGGVLDCAKAVGARIAAPNVTLEGVQMQRTVHATLPPLFAVPTTAGSGSEVTATAFIAHTDTHRMITLVGSCLIPTYAVHDPRITFSLPPQQTMTAALSALASATEARIERRATANTCANSEFTAALIGSYLDRACVKGDDEEARANLLNAAYCAGLANANRHSGYVRSLTHSLCVRYGMPYAPTCAQILPHVLRRYGSAITRQLAAMARIGTIARGDEDDNDAAEAFIHWIDDTNARAGLPRFVTGIKEADIPALSAYAAAESNPHYAAPVLLDASDLAALFYTIAGERMGFGA